VCLVVAQIILLLWWFNKKILVKKTNQKDLVKMFESNSIVQNGTLVKLDMGAKKPEGEVFLIKILGKKKPVFLVVKVCIVLSFFFLLTKVICS
jgi:hypothetical protein